MCKEGIPNELHLTLGYTKDMWCGWITWLNPLTPQSIPVFYSCLTYLFICFSLLLQHQRELPHSERCSSLPPQGEKPHAKHCTSDQPEQEQAYRWILVPTNETANSILTQQQKKGQKLLKNWRGANIPACFALSILWLQFLFHILHSTPFKHLTVNFKLHLYLNRSTGCASS